MACRPLARRTKQGDRRPLARYTLAHGKEKWHQVLVFSLQRVLLACPMWPFELLVTLTVLRPLKLQSV